MGRSTSSTGVVRILLDLASNIEGRHVVIVEDIVDTGQTLDYILRNFAARNPASVRVATLSTSPAGARSVPVHFVGFEIPNEL